jgi:tight adherence protein B
MSVALTVAIAAFVAVTALVLLISILTQRRPEAVRRRLEAHAVEVVAARTKRLERISVLKREAYGSIHGSGKLLGRVRPSETAMVELSRAGLNLGVRKYLALRVVAGLVAFVAAMILLGNALLALPAILIGTQAPRLWLRHQGKKRVKAFEAQLAELIDLLVGALRAGHGFLQGLESVSNQIEDPTRSELTKVLEEVNIGISPVDSLQAMGGRIPSYDFSLLISAIALQRQTGGNLAEVLENLAHTVRERRRVRGEVHALTTGPRASSYVLAAVPTLLFLYFISISSDYRKVMLGTTYGHMLLAAAAVLSMLGFVFSRKVAKVEY